MPLARVEGAENLKENVFDGVVGINIPAADIFAQYGDMSGADTIIEGTTVRYVNK